MPDINTSREPHEPSLGLRPLGIALSCLVLALMLPTSPRADPSEATDGPATAGQNRDGDAEPAAPQDSETEAPKLTSPSAIQRELDIAQRDLEELLVRIGDKDPSASQRTKLHESLVKLSDLRRQLEEAQARVDAKMEAEGSSFKGKWMQVRKSLENFSNYDVKDGMFRIRIGLRFQFDGTAGWETDDLEAAAGGITNSFNFRRARVFAAGRLFRRMDFMFEYDFAADAGFKDVYLEGSKFTKYFKWRIGHFKEPVSLARHTSAFHLGFLEWALPVQALAPGRNWGLMFRHSEGDERLTWAVSMTTDGKTTDDNRSNSKFTLTGRVTGLPQYKDDGRRLVHLGVSYRASSPKGGETSFGARPEARFAPFFIDTGSIDADRSSLFGFEAATVQGPWWVQAEWLGNDIDSDEFGSVLLGGGYVEVGRFLTGESRFYFVQEAVFGRLVPNRPFKGGSPFKKKSNGGALEVTARVSSLDLNDGYVTGGEMRNLSLGINWYVTQSSHVMFNYIHSKVKDLGHADILLVRYQFNP